MINDPARILKIKILKNPWSSIQNPGRLPKESQRILKNPGLVYRRIPKNPERILDRLPKIVNNPEKIPKDPEAGFNENLERILKDPTRGWQTLAQKTNRH